MAPQSHDIAVSLTLKRDSAEQYGLCCAAGN